MLSRFVLCALTCALTLAASGDDFCLPRLLASSSLATSGDLPLDDPNTDFLAPTARGVAPRSPLRDGDRENPAALGPRVVSCSAAGRPLIALDALTPCQYGPLTGRALPLRC